MKKTIIVLLALTFQASAQEEKGMGLKVDRKRDEKVALIPKPLGFGENLPETYSLKEYLPTIGNQGNYGTCGGWSSTYYLATMEYAILKGLTNKTEISANVYDPLYTYSSALDPKDNTCSEGTYLDALCETLKNQGAKRMNIDQLACGADLSDVHQEQNSVIDFTKYYRLYDWYDSWETNTIAICAAVSEKHPVLIGMLLPESFFYIGSDGLFSPSDYELEDPIGTSKGGHAMCIVGYDDNKYGGCFEVVNSWGGSWGDNGVCYIKYTDFHEFAIAAYSLETKLRTLETSEPACIYGDCNNGYGVQILKKGARFEGLFSNGEIQKGIYLSNGFRRFGTGKSKMKKLLKKSYGEYLYDPYDYDNKKPIGCIIK